MDFLPIYKGVLNILVSIGVAAGSTLASPQIPQPDLKSPGVIEAYNISSENFNVQPPLVTLGEALTENLEAEGLKEVKLASISEPTPSIEPEVIVGPVQPQTVIRPEPKVEKAESEEDDVKESSTVLPSPSSIPETSATPSPNPLPTTAPETVSVSGNSQRMFDMVNDYRKGKGLAAFEKDSRLCELTEKRAPQVDGELASGTLHKGFKELNLPYWATENIAAYSSIEQNLQFWLSDYIHKKAIESDAKYSCVACSGSSCSQIFSSFVQK